SRRRHTRSDRDWSSDVCSSDLLTAPEEVLAGFAHFLERYWCSGMNEKWQLRVERLEREARETQARIARGSLADFLGTLPLDVRRSEERRVGKECRSDRKSVVRE